MNLLRFHEKLSDGRFRQWAPRRIVRPLAIPALRRGVAGELFPRGKEGSALQITDGRRIILTVERELQAAPHQARRHEKQDNQAHEWLPEQHAVLHRLHNHPAQRVCVQWLRLRQMPPARVDVAVEDRARDR